MGLLGWVIWNRDPCPYATPETHSLVQQRAERKHTGLKWSRLASPSSSQTWMHNRTPGEPGKTQILGPFLEFLNQNLEHLNIWILEVAQLIVRPEVSVTGAGGCLGTSGPEFSVSVDRMWGGLTLTSLNPPLRLAVLMQRNEVGPQLHTIYKNQLKMDQRPKWPIWEGTIYPEHIKNSYNSRKKKKKTTQIWTRLPWWSSG